MKRKSNTDQAMKVKGGQGKSKRGKSSNESIVDKGYTSVSDFSTGYIFANTPLNMEDEERNPDCC